jgi:dTDP-4-amino-4,6-dideoxygalactose transaminase
VPIHRQDAYREEFSEVFLPVTEKIANQIVSIPVYPELTDEEVDFVIETVKRFFVGI